MKRLLAIASVLVAAAVLVVFGTGASDDGGHYRVRAIFMNAFSVIPGEDVKIAGVKVGKIESLDVTPDHKAAVVLRIDRPGFDDFRQDAECTIRPQSLIGEKFVECTPTQPRPENAQPAPKLRKIERGAGKGQYLLPVSQTSKPVDLDLVNNTLRLPYRERLTIIINELGTGLAGRGGDLRLAIRNADPALKETDKVLRILADQNRTLANLARDSDVILAPLARDRARVASFVTQAKITSQATAERSNALEQDIAKLPAFLRELTPTMQSLGAFADQATPVFTGLGKEAPSINRFIEELGPFSHGGDPGVPVPGRRRRRRRSCADQEQADHHRRRSARREREAADQQPRVAAHLAEEHRRDRAPDGLPLLPSGRDQRLRFLRPLPARRSHPQRLLAVRDRELARLPGDVRQHSGSGSARAASAEQRPGLRRHAPVRLVAPARRLFPRQDAATAHAERAEGPRGPQGDGFEGGARRRTTSARRRRRPRPRARPRARIRRSRCSTTCWGATADAPRLGLHRRQPGAHRRRDDARGHRRRLPGLQRQLGPALRPHLRAQDAGSQRGQPRQGQRRAHRRHARRRGDRHHPGHGQRRLGHRRAHAQARDHRQAAAGRLDRAHPPALGAGPQVRRDHEGDVEPGLPGRRDDPAAQRTAAAGRARRGPQHVRREDPRGLAEQPDRVRQRLRRPGARPQPGDRGAQPAADQPRAGHAEPLGPTDARRAPGARPRADRVDRRTGGRDAGGAVRQPRHHLPRPRQRRAPVPAGLDQRRAARARRGDQGLPAAAAVPGQQRGPLPRAAAGGPGAVDGGAGPGRRARDRHADAQALGGVQQQPRARLRGARALRR